MDAAASQNVVMPFGDNFLEYTTYPLLDHVNITPLASPYPTIETSPYVTCFKE